jgi:hypothetical protein
MMALIVSWKGRGQTLSQPRNSGPALGADDTVRLLAGSLNVFLH